MISFRATPTIAPVASQYQKLNLAPETPYDFYHAAYGWKETKNINADAISTRFFVQILCLINKVC
jgi:hypothetical protein